MALSPDVWRALTNTADQDVGDVPESASNAVLIVDARRSNLSLVLANATACRVLGSAPGERRIVGSLLRDWLSEAQTALVAQTVAGLSRLRPTAQCLVAWPLGHGEAPAITTIKLLDWDPGQALVMLSFWAEPPPRSASSAGMPAQSAPNAHPAGRMRRSEDFLRATMAHTADTLVFLDKALRIRFVNKACDGRSIQDLVGCEFEVLLPDRAREPVVDKLRRLVSTGEAVETQCEALDGDGVPRYLEIRAGLVLDAGVGMGVSVAIRDITELKRLEREILEGLTRERQRIGRDLHDGLGQELTGVALMLRALATRLGRECPAEAESANEIIGLVNQSLDSARALAHGLLPVSVERGGLIFALRSLAKRSRDVYGMDVRFRAEVWPELRLGETQAGDLYRIAQEALTNAARHSRATWVKITLQVDHGGYCLKIVDNGVGIPGTGRSAAGMGLQIMAHRAEIIGAKLEILPHTPHGTLIRVTGTQAACESEV